MSKQIILYFLLILAFAVSFFVFMRSIDTQETWRVIASGIGMTSFLGLIITFLFQQKKSKTR